MNKERIEGVRSQESIETLEPLGPQILEPLENKQEVAMGRTDIGPPNFREMIPEVIS